MRFCHGVMKSVTRDNETPVSDLKADFAPPIRKALVKQKISATAASAVRRRSIMRL